MKYFLKSCHLYGRIDLKKYTSFGINFRQKQEEMKKTRKKKKRRVAQKVEKINTTVFLASFVSE